MTGGGCKFHRNDPPRMNLNQSPLIVDEAMQKRDWERSTVQYANGDTIAGPHLIVVESAGPAWLQRVTDPAVSTANNVAIPATTILSPPWKDVIYQGMVIPPTYSAQPPPNVVK
jgi:hypothetical protein